MIFLWHYSQCIFKFDEFAAFINEQYGDSVAVDIAITDIETIGDDVSWIITVINEKFCLALIKLKLESALRQYSDQIINFNKF